MGNEIEKEFLESIEAVKTENGNYLYESKGGVHMIRLDCILGDYKDWLIVKGIVKEI